MAAVVAALLISWRLNLFEASDPSASDRSNSPTEPAYHFRLGLNLSAGSALHAAAVKFAERVQEKSAGRIHISVHPDQELGNDQQMLEMARDGTLELLLTPTAKLSTDVPAMQYADLPFYFKDREELYAMLDGEPGDLLLGKLKRVGLIGVTFWENGFKQFTTNRPIHGPEDFAGLRIRTMKSRLIMDQFSVMGAEPVVIDFAAVYQALADGAVSGQENPLVAIVGKRLHEVQSHLTISNHAWLGYVFSVSKSVFESLPEDVRLLIVETAKELSDWERKETARREEKLLHVIRGAGVEVRVLDAEQRRRFARVLAPLTRRYGFEIGYDLLAKTEEMRFSAMLEKQGDGDPLPLVLGLDADLSADGRVAGGAIYRGMEMAIGEINDAGGLLERRVTILPRDHMHNNQRGLTNLQVFTHTPGTLAIVGGMHSSVVHSELEAIHQTRIPYLIPWAAARTIITHDHTPSHTFRLSLIDQWVAPFLLTQALERGSRVAVFLERSVWGRSNEAEMRNLMESLPPDRVLFDWVSQGERDFRERLRGLRAQGVDIVIMVANFFEASALVKSMATLENPLPILAHWGLTGGDFWSRNRKSLERVDLRFVQSVFLESEDTSPRLRDFIRRYRAYYGLRDDEPIPAPVGTAHAYDLVHILAKAVRKAGTSDQQAIRDALERVDVYEGLVKTYAPPFTAERHEALDAGVLRLARFDEFGRIVEAR